MREAVTHSQRLSITLRYLATDDNFYDLKIVTVTSQSMELLCWRCVYCSAGSRLLNEYCAVLYRVGPGSSVGIATDYGLDGPEIESRWGEIFRACPDRP
jgi:hypothetical protein